MEYVTFLATFRRSLGTFPGPDCMSGDEVGEKSVPDYMGCLPGNRLNDEMIISTTESQNFKLKSMKKIGLSLFLIVFMACSTLRVNYDFDKQADFSAYKNYAFSEGTHNLPVDQLNRDRIIKAVENEMAAKGFTKSENPDVLVDLHLKAEQKVDATATTTGSPWGYRYGGGFSTTQINYNEYTEGTLFINMVDASTERIVWQGIGTRTIEEQASAKKREYNINETIKQIFSKYPPKQ
jgi:FlaG/FlaF family flagellin (archaellin)